MTNCNDDSLITTLTGHTGTVYCLIIDDGKLYSGSADRTIKIWNCSTDTLIKTLTGHTHWVQCLTISDGKLYSGSYDHSIKVWNCSNHKLITTLGVPEEHDEEGEYEGHTGAVRCLTINDGKLYSGGGYHDNSIKVWNCSNHELITTLGAPEAHDEEGEYEGHTDVVWCLTINDGKLYSGSFDKTIKVWDCSTNKLITTLTEHTDGVELLRIHCGKLYSAAYNVIKVYDCSDDTLITTLEDHTGYIRCLEIHDGKLYTGSGDRTINVYDCSDDSLITTLRGHTSGVSDLTFQNGKLYSKQHGGAIYIWQL